MAANYHRLETTDANPGDDDYDLKSPSITTTKAPKIIGSSPAAEAVPIGWPAERCVHTVGDPATVHKSQWQTGIFSCIGIGDQFYSSDVEVCFLGGVAPCVLHGSNAERINLGSGSNSFASHCLPYAGLCMLGNFFFGWNCLAPWFSYHVRTAIRRKFNLEGNCETVGRVCGWCGGIAMDEVQQEQCETACDLATHVFCHACALCQEAREVRRRLPLPHPGHNVQPPVLLMIPPAGQTMGKGNPHVP